MIVGVTYPRRFDPRPSAAMEADLQRLRLVDPLIDVIVAPYEDGDELDADSVRAWARMDAVLAHGLPVHIHEIAPRLRWVHLIGTGAEHVLEQLSLGHDVQLTSSAGVNAASIAEFAIGRLLAHWKHFDLLASQQAEHAWIPRHGRRLAGCTVGVIGLGAIGKALCTRLRAFDVAVWGCRRDPSQPTPLVDHLVGPAQLGELLAACDAVIVAVPETVDTQRLMNDQAFSAMRPGSWFCNVSRGSIVDEDALLRHLRSGHLAGASIDVTDQEPLPADSPLWSCPGLGISPHCAASLDGHFDAVHDLFRDNLERLIRGEALLNVVDRQRGY